MPGHVELLCRIVYEGQRGSMTDEQWENHWRLVETRPDLLPQSPRLPEWWVLRDVKAALERLEIAGYVVVPSDPTEEMLHEAVESASTFSDLSDAGVTLEQCKNVWLEMVSARPTE